jgi:HPt (histidine-containing phosphotransfer) domain-containing protein
MDDFIAKPVNLATLGRVMATWLNPGAARLVEDDATLTDDPANAVVRSVLDRLLDELEDPSLLQTVVATYRRELPGRVEAIEDAARARDLDRLRDVAHTLKSTSAAVGAVHLARLCQELEEHARDGAPPAPGLELLLAKVAQQRDEVDMGLEEEMRRLESSADLRSEDVPGQALGSVSQHAP